MSFSYRFYFVFNNLDVILVFLTIILNIPNILTQNDQIVINMSDKQNRNASIHNKVPYEEFFIEHNISQEDAKRNFQEIGIKLLEGM